MKGGFEVLYLTYEEYRTLGGKLTQTAFMRIISRVSGIIASATHSRIDSMKVIPLQVKALTMDLIEYCVGNNVNEKPISSKSQSANGVSESESYAVKSAKEQEVDIQGLIYDHLMSVKDDNGTPLLYRGASI